MTCPSTGSDPACRTCRDTGLVSFTGRGSDGPDPCPRCNPCPAGGPHVFQRLDPRDADTWGRTGLACVECGAAPKEERRG